MADELRKRKRGARRKNNPNIKSPNLSSSSTGITKKKRVSWAENLESFQIEGLYPGLNGTPTSVKSYLCSGALTTSTPAKSALATKRLKPEKASKRSQDIDEIKNIDDIDDIDAIGKIEEPTANNVRHIAIDASSKISCVRPKAINGTSEITNGAVLNDDDSTPTGPTKTKKKQKGRPKRAGESNIANGNDRTMEEESRHNEAFKLSEMQEGRELEIVDAASTNNSTDNVPNSKVRNRSQKTDPTRSIFVGNLPFDLNRSELKAFFEDRVGEVELVRAVEDRTTRMGKGYAFITFKTADMVSKAMAMQDAVCFEGRELRMQEIIRKKKNRPVAVADASNLHPLSKKKHQAERILKHKLANYIVTKKTFSTLRSGDTPKLSKKAIKSIKKRKNRKTKKRVLLT